MALNQECTDIHDDFLNSAAEKYFNVKYLFPYQRLIISNILEITSKTENDFPKGQIVILPTGAGKSLCFMLPSLLIEKPTLIIFPLLSLMADQKRRLDEAGIKTAVIKGGQERKEREEIFRGIESGRYRVILTNPETLSREEILTFFTPAEGKPVIGHVVIDEAHTVSEWGDSFRSAYLATGNIIEKINPDAVTAFTATASESILKRLKDIIFRNSQINIISANPDRTNIRYSVVKSVSKTHDIIWLAEKAEKPAVIFCSSRVSAELTAQILVRNSSLKEVRFYHAGLESDEKKNIEKWFFSSDSGVLSATCAYGLGVDKSNIRTVIHYELPGSVESYLQESGRGGRDRKEARAIVLFSEKDRKRLELFKSETEKKRYLKLLEFAETENKCRRNILLRALSEESETDFCEGCDICNRTYSPYAEGRTQIINLVKENNRTLTEKEAVSILAGSENAFGRADLINQSAFYGNLSGWTEESIKEGIGSLVKEGVITRGRCLWKNHLIISKQRRK